MTRTTEHDYNCPECGSTTYHVTDNGNDLGPVVGCTECGEVLGFLTQNPSEGT